VLAIRKALGWWEGWEGLDSDAGAHPIRPAAMRSLIELQFRALSVMRESA
jgi:hypothetical protein